MWPRRTRGGLEGGRVAMTRMGGTGTVEDRMQPRFLLLRLGGCCSINRGGSAETALCYCLQW